jgi:hypothetical protein
MTVGSVYCPASPLEAQRRKTVRIAAVVISCI